MLFSFQILVLSYELFISLPFFSHFPDNHQSYQIYPQLSDETVILCVQSMLDVFTSREHPPWTLLGMSHLRKRRMGILNTRQGEVCMVAPPLLDVHFHFLSLFSDTNQVITNHTRNNIQNLTGQLFFVCKHCWLYLRSVTTLHEPCRGCSILDDMGWESWTPGKGRSAWWRHPCRMFIPIFFSLDSHWILQDIMIFRSWSIPHKLCIVNHQGWSSLLHLFKPKRWFFFISMSLVPRCSN